MATIVNTPGGDNGGGGGWAVAIIILIVVLVGAFLLWGGFGRSGGNIPDTTNIDVSVPTPDIGGSGSPMGGSDDGTADQGPGDN